MKIINEGNAALALAKRERIVEFHCKLCGCIWEANKTEYRDESNQREGNQFSCMCPTCKEITWSYKYKYD